MLCLSFATLLLVRASLVPDSPVPLPAVVVNDNRHPAGSLQDGALTLELRARAGIWRPEGESGRTIRIDAFGEGSSAPSAPAPLIRVPEGTTIAATVHNDLEYGLRVHGLCDRRMPACLPLDVPAGESRQAQFTSGLAGTYHYWATTTGMPMQFRGAGDTQLSGAFIVDPADAPIVEDRIFVITEWTSVTRDQLLRIASDDDPGASFLKLKPDVLFLINGRVWPHTERLAYERGDRVKWRVINLSTQVHPMHLHGFYFEVDSLGDGLRDQTFGFGQKAWVVTQLMQPGTTMAMTWTPQRAGNWLFHCHVMTHVSPSLHVDGSPKPAKGHEHHLAAGMTGMVLGVTVRDGTRAGARHRGEDENVLTVPGAGTVAPRKLTLVMRRDPQRFGDEPAFGFQLAAADSAEARQPVPVPGPLLVLKRGEPVEITLINQLPEATAVHWHGMELDSYYDGVHGFGGMGLRVTPLIEPRGTFVVRFTPPRTGTFIYHTHLHDRRQLTSGLYGAMLVIEPKETFDDSTDHVVVLGRGGPQAGAPVVLNGDRSPVMVWKSGARHRVRLINITPDDILLVSLQSAERPAPWRPLTKDGATVPSERSEAGPARQIIGVGETYDFEVETLPGRQNLWLEVRSPGGKWHAQGRVIVK
jgi:manganese oxidase